MPKGLPNIISKARYLYLELGKRSFYDRSIEYLMFGEEKFNMIYEDKLYSNPNYVVCTSLIKQNKELLNMVNIKSHIVLDRYQHSSLVFEDELGTEHVTDLTNDLKNIQFNCSTSYFAKDTIPANILRKVDFSLGYISNTRGYSNDYWNILKKRLINSKLSLESKLDIILNSLKDFGDLSKLGESELNSLYSKFVKYCTNNYYRIHFFSSKRPNTQEEFFIELIENDYRILYKLDRQTLQFQKFDKIKIMEDRYK